MLFSIITVCFNSAKTIRQTFDSVLQQGFKDYEYIVVDGASTDGTVDIIKEYEPKFEGRMHWISEKDNGIYDAMNKGCRLAKGTFLNFLNSDDSYYDGDSLDIVAKTVEKNPSHDVYYGIAMNVNRKGPVCAIQIYHTELPGKPLKHQAMWYKTASFKEIGFYDTQFKIGADFDSEITLFERGFSFCFIPHLIVCFSIEGLTGKQESAELCDLENMRVWKKHGCVSEAEFMKSLQIEQWASFKRRVFAVVKTVLLIELAKKIFLYCHKETE